MDCNDARDQHLQQLTDCLKVISQPSKAVRSKINAEAEYAAAVNDLCDLIDEIGIYALGSRVDTVRDAMDWADECKLAAKKETKDA